MARRTMLIGAGMLAIIASSAIAIAAYVGAAERGKAWQSIAWPFPRDGWPPGHAYRCRAASCGSELELYVRPKIGFCNCDTGVADDDEADRVADLDLIGPRFPPVAAGPGGARRRHGGPDEKLQPRYERWIDAPSRWHCGVASV